MRFAGLRDPLLLFAVAGRPSRSCLAFAGYGRPGRHRLRLPRHALGAGPRAAATVRPIYPEPTRAAMEIGNPSVYPPPFILLRFRSRCSPRSPRHGCGPCVLARGAAGGAADPRGPRLALLRPRCDVAGRRARAARGESHAPARPSRGRSRGGTATGPVVAGLAVGAAIAAKLFLWPLLVWLLFTRRLTAAVVGAALGRRRSSRPRGPSSASRASPTIPASCGRSQDVYATRSFSLATVAGGLGASTGVAVAVCTRRRVVAVWPGRPGSPAEQTAIDGRSRWSWRRASSRRRSSGRTTPRSCSSRSPSRGRGSRPRGSSAIRSGSPASCRNPSMHGSRAMLPPGRRAGDRLGRQPRRARTMVRGGGDVGGHRGSAGSGRRPLEPRGRREPPASRRRTGRRCRSRQATGPSGARQP